MAYNNSRKTRALLGDIRGMSGIGTAELNGLLNRGSRDMMRRGLLAQKIEVIDLTATTRVYTLPSDHVLTFAMFRERYSASIRLLDQGGNAWFLVVTQGGVMSLVSTQPAGQIVLSTPNTSWLEIASPDATTWYVYPSPIGMLVSSTTQPATGTGSSSTVQLRDNVGTPWYPAITDTGIVTASTSGSATLTATAVDDHAMQRVEPEAIEHLDTRATSSAPERYAIIGKQLIVHPVPDVAYQIKHFYFSEDVNSVPDAVQYLPVLFATAMGVQRMRRLMASRQMLGMYRAELSMMAEVLYPGSRDGLDFYRMQP